MSSTRGYTRAQVEALSQRLGEPDWLLARRLDAFEQFEATPYPTRRDEAWRRAQLESVDFDSLTNLVVANGADPTPATTWDGELAGVVRFVDDRLAEQRLDPALADAGVVLCSLHDGLKAYPELLKRHFMTDCVPVDEDKFSLLHAALFQSGTFCYIPAGIELDQPLGSLVTLAHGGGTFLHHTLIVVGDGARASFVELYDGGGEGETLAVPITEVILERGAKATYAAVQNWQPNVVEIAYRRALVGQEASAFVGFGALGGRLDLSFSGAVLNGRGGHCELSGFYLPQAGQHVCCTTLQDHRVGECTSNLLFKGALLDQAKTIFRGVVKVHRDAQKTDAYQTNNNLLLGDEARADSLPILEIEADDVRCSHGATLSTLDEEDLFYLRSRGLSLETARNMVINGFFEPVLEQIPVPGLRAQVAAEISTRVRRQEHD